MTQGTGMTVLTLDHPDYKYMGMSVVREPPHYNLKSTYVWTGQDIQLGLIIFSFLTSGALDSDVAAVARVHTQNQELYKISRGRILHHILPDPSQNKEIRLVIQRTCLV